MPELHRRLAREADRNAASPPPFDTAVLGRVRRRRRVTVAVSCMVAVGVVVAVPLGLAASGQDAGAPSVGAPISATTASLLQTSGPAPSPAATAVATNSVATSSAAPSPTATTGAAASSRADQSGTAALPLACADLRVTATVGGHAVSFGSTGVAAMTIRQSESVLLNATGGCALGVVYVPDHGVMALTGGQAAQPIWNGGAAPAKPRPVSFTPTGAGRGSIAVVVANGHSNDRANPTAFVISVTVHG